MLYLDLTNELDQNNEITITNNYTINESNLPVIVIIENSQVVEIYNIKENNYDENKLEAFLNQNNIIGD